MRLSYAGCRGAGTRTHLGARWVREFAHRRALMQPTREAWKRDASAVVLSSCVVFLRGIPPTLSER